MFRKDANKSLVLNRLPFHFSQGKLHVITLRKCSTHLNVEWNTKQFCFDSGDVSSSASVSDICKDINANDISSYLSQVEQQEYTTR